MSRARPIVLGLAAIVAVLFLLDWTIGALDVMQLRRLADLRRARAAMTELDSGALVLRPGADLLLGDGSFRLCSDADGRRAASPAAESDLDASIRLVVLGDAATLGWGVDDSLSFARQLESRLRDQQRSIRVDNLAQLFFRPADLASVLRDCGTGTSPRAVLVCGPSSRYALPPRWHQIAAGSEPPAPWWGRVWPSISGLGERVGDGVVELEEAEFDAASWTAGLNQLRALCEQRGVELLAIDLGHAGFLALCESVRIRCLTIAPDQVERRARLFLDATERLPNGPGHYLLGRKAGEALSPLLPAIAR